MEIARHDPNRFDPSAAPALMTQDEESSGIIDASAIFDPSGATGLGYALLDVQAHYNNGATLVEGGQLLLLTYNPFAIPEPGSAFLLGFGLVGLAIRRRRVHPGG